MIKLGTRVYTNLYNYGAGIVVAIHGEQNPESVRNAFNGVVGMGGNAEFTIIFADGRSSYRLPECILHGVQWQILDEEPADATEIEQAKAKAAQYKDEAQRKAEAKAQAKEEARQALRSDPEYAHLIQLDRYSGGKEVAKNVRRELKKHFPGIKFSVRSDYNTVRVSFSDETINQREVEDKVDIFEEGHFNGMEDIYERSDAPFNDVYGGVKFVFVSFHR